MHLKLQTSDNASILKTKGEQHLFAADLKENTFFISRITTNQALIGNEHLMFPSEITNFR